MKILTISSEKREDFSSTPSLLALALNAMGHNVSVWRSGFFEKFNTPIIKLSDYKKEIDDFDVVIATNCGQKIIDFSNIKGEKIFLYYEGFDSPILPLGDFDEMWCHKNHLNLFRYCNPFQKEPIITRLIVKPAIAPEFWNGPKKWNDRQIKVAYNGALQEPKNIDPLLNYWMIERYKFCFELKDLLHKENIDIRLPIIERNEISNWRTEFRDTKINLHLSQEFGVGQGALEAGLNKCALVEYCTRDLAKDFGLQDNENCVVVETVKEAYEAIKFLLKHDKIAKDYGKELYKFALTHTYLKFIPVLKEILG